MPVISDIRQQKRHTDRYSVYLDGKYAFSLSGLDLSNSGLRRGDELSEAQVDQWQRVAGERKAYNLALRYLGQRARSEEEIRAYLQRKDYADEVVAAVLEQLVELRLIDDSEFARQWVRDRQTFRPRSRRVLEMELYRKGIAAEIVQAVLGEMGEEGQEQMLADVIRKKRRLPRYQDNEKLTGYLARQGFSYDQIKKALMRLDD